MKEVNELLSNLRMARLVKSETWRTRIKGYGLMKRLPKQCKTYLVFDRGKEFVIKTTQSESQREAATTWADI